MYGEDDGGFMRRETATVSELPIDWCEDCDEEFEFCECEREEEEVDHGCRHDNYWFGRE